jgi:AcrR family transcriptional regulator
MARPRTDIAPRIVRAARERFLLDGVDGASLRTIAQDAKTNVGMIYYYFRTKDDLFLAVVESVYLGLVTDIEAILATEDVLEDKLRNVYIRLGAMNEEEMTVVRLMVREALVSSSRLARLVERFQRGHFLLLIKTLGEGVANGAIDSDIPLPLLVTSSMAIGLVPQLLLRLIGDTGPFGMVPRGKALADLSVDVLFHGISRREKKPKKHK